MCVAMAVPAGYENPDEWELVNDDGFVHKRRKRPRIDPAAATSSSTPPPPDPAVERKHRRERKKTALLKLREKYLKEISWWGLLSNTLKEMERNAQTQLPEENQELDSITTLFGGASSSEDGFGSYSTRRRVVDDLLSQVEAQEAIIRDVSSLCAVAEALCSAQEERLKQQLTDLPIWEPSPHELMAALGKQIVVL